MTQYIEAPTIVNMLHGHAIFLAGGITGCVNWQKVAKNALMKSNKYDFIVNPRRENFDLLDVDVAEEQIQWEADQLQRCNEILFWFSSETVQPITLFELGRYCTKKPIIHVGCDPEYSRKFDVKTQMSIYRPDIKIWDNLDDMLEYVAGDIITLDNPLLF